MGAPAGITISVPGAESQDAERRRQIALRALSERLSKIEPSSAVEQWPSMNETEEEDTDNKNKEGDDLKKEDEKEKEVLVQIY